MINRMLRRAISTVLMITGCIVYGNTPAYAVPGLQLDITGGTYEPVTGTTISNSTDFELNAYLMPTDSTPGYGFYYLSVAVVPEYGDISSEFGSFTINGLSYDVTTGMRYGIPPVEFNSRVTPDEGDLGTHEIYPTYFLGLFLIWSG